MTRLCLIEEEFYLITHQIQLINSFFTYIFTLQERNFPISISTIGYDGGYLGMPIEKKLQECDGNVSREAYCTQCELLADWQVKTDEITNRMETS